MKKLFSARGEEALRRFLWRMPILAFDFDGTLAPLGDDPTKVRTPAKIAKLMRELDRHYRIAVISGRSARDLKRRLGFKPEFIVGNHGLEGLAEFVPRAYRAHGVCERWAPALERRLEDLISREPGVFIENKGLTLSVHYRMAKHKRSAAQEIRRAIDKLRPEPRVVTGQDLFNLVPKGSPHKGLALMQITGGVYPAIFVGDDVTDEDVFRNMHEDWLGVRIGKGPSKAHYRLDSIDDMERFLEIAKEVGVALREMLNRHRESSARRFGRRGPRRSASK